MSVSVGNYTEIYTGGWFTSDLGAVATKIGVATRGWWTGAIIELPIVHTPFLSLGLKFINMVINIRDDLKLTIGIKDDLTLNADIR